MKKLIETCGQFSRPVIRVITVATPYIITYSDRAYRTYKTLPKDTARFVIGFVFCFFGGLYPTLFAAIEAAKHGGIETIANALGDLADEATKVIEASKKDDEIDKDKNGVKDVDQISGQELILRKVNLVVTKMDPAKVDNAISSIYTVWLSVVGVLTLQFARTIALAVSISDFLKQPMDRFVVSTLRSLIPIEYHKWVPIMLGWFTKFIAMSIAWYIQTVLSAFTSALTGGLMMARAFIDIANRKKWHLGGLLPKNHEETNLDELSSYVFAFMGFYFQFSHNFHTPFPLNILLLPVEISEDMIKWSITKTD